MLHLLSLGLFKRHLTLTSLTTGKRGHLRLRARSLGRLGRPLGRSSGRRLTLHTLARLLVVRRLPPTRQAPSRGRRLRGCHTPGAHLGFVIARVPTTFVGAVGTRRVGTRRVGTRAAAARAGCAGAAAPGAATPGGAPAAACCLQYPTRKLFLVLLVLVLARYIARTLTTYEAIAVQIGLHLNVGGAPAGSGAGAAGDQARLAARATPRACLSCLLPWCVAFEADARAIVQRFPARAAAAAASTPFRRLASRAAAHGCQSTIRRGGAPTSLDAQYSSSVGAVIQVIKPSLGTWLHRTRAARDAHARLGRLGAASDESLHAHPRAMTATLMRRRPAAAATGSAAGSAAGGAEILQTDAIIVVLLIAGAGQHHDRRCCHWTLHIRDAAPLLRGHRHAIQTL